MKMQKIYQWFDKNIFNNIGRKVQECAIFTLIIDIVVVIVGTITVFIAFDPFYAIIIPVIGLSYALGFTYPIYAFGQLVEDIHKTQENTRPPATDINELPEL